MYLSDPQMYAVDSKLRASVWCWALQSNVHIEYNGTDFGLDIWRVPSSQHQTLFALRWL